MRTGTAVVKVVDEGEGMIRMVSDRPMAAHTEGAFVSVTWDDAEPASTEVARLEGIIDAAAENVAKWRRAAVEETPLTATERQIQEGLVELLDGIAATLVR